MMRWPHPLEPQDLRAHESLESPGLCLPAPELAARRSVPAERSWADEESLCDELLPIGKFLKKNVPWNTITENVALANIVDQMSARGLIKICH